MLSLPDEIAGTAISTDQETLQSFRDKRWSRLGWVDEIVPMNADSAGEHATYEIELKYRVPDLAELEYRLQQAGAQFVGLEHHVDHYFNHPCRDFVVTDEVFRLRECNDSVHFTYKGPKLDTQTKTRRELEFLVGANTVQLRELLELLSFRFVAAVAKQRSVYRLRWGDRDFTVGLDRVAEVGIFAELETLSNLAEAAAARNQLLELAQQLHLEVVERCSYLRMHLIRQEMLTAGDAAQDLSDYPAQPPIPQVANPSAATELVDSEPGVAAATSWPVVAIPPHLAERAVVAFGANLGEPSKTYTQIQAQLRELPQTRLLACSQLYLTPPAGLNANAPSFYNAVLLLETSLASATLLQHLHTIETAAGRPPRTPAQTLTRTTSETAGPEYDSRIVDLDLLFFGNTIQQAEPTSPNIRLPHPRLHYRRFVLDPLVEVAPDLIHPVFGETVAQLHQRVQQRAPLFLCWVDNTGSLDYFRNRMLEQFGEAARSLAFPSVALHDACVAVGEPIQALRIGRSKWQQWNLSVLNCWGIVFDGPSSGPVPSNTIPSNTGSSQVDDAAPLYLPAVDLRQPDAAGVRWAVDAFFASLLPPQPINPDGQE